MSKKTFPRAAQLRCLDCGWKQDRFWEPDIDGHTPLATAKINFLRAQLFRDKVLWIDPATNKSSIVSGPEYVAKELRRIIAQIEGMKIRTLKEWNARQNDWRCPDCGSNNCSTDG